MVPSNSWGQHAGWGTAGSGPGGAWPAIRATEKSAKEAHMSRLLLVALEYRTRPRLHHLVIVVPYLQDGLLQIRRKVQTRPSSRSSSSSDSALTSSSASQHPPNSRRIPLHSPAVRSSLQGGVSKARTEEGESTPDPTTYMNTLANSATLTPRFGRGPPYPNRI